MKPTGPWAIKWSTNSPLDGKREFFVGGARIARPSEFRGCTTILFATKSEAVKFIRAEYGYIAKRKDLRWRMPKAVRVTVSIEEAAA